MRFRREVIARDALLVRTREASLRTSHPWRIVAVPRASPGALLGAGGMAGLADSLRTTLTTLEPVTGHASLPYGRLVTEQPHQPPTGPA